MNKLLVLLPALIFILTIDALSQPFAQQTITVEGAGRSAVAWGDYDNDGDLDLVVTGEKSNGSYLSRIYRNDDGTLVADTNTLLGTKDGSAAWGDFDNDSDLDLLISGETEEDGNICLIYRNNDGAFEAIDAGLHGVGYGDASWGDFDNDGDLDVLVAGNWVVKLYEYVDGQYIATENDFGYLQNVKSSWGDFDNDGDLDILLIGDTGGGYFSDIFLNDNGEYVQANLEMTGLFSGSADLIDFDNDGDLDISISGFDIYLDARFNMYENLGDGTIQQYFTGMEGIATGTVDWGDYDNDGDLDVLMSGKNAACGSSITKVYRNDNGYFTMETGATLDGAIRCCAAWADYDNDGDLDFLLSGMTLAEYPFTKLYRNEAGSNEYTINNIPEAPSNLEAIVEGQSVVLSWDKASDAETPQDGLSYNVYIGTESGQCQILSAQANSESGYRFVQALGNANMKTYLNISTLPQGTYYWSVQTIDQAFAGSQFSEENSFSIIETSIHEDISNAAFSIYPNPATDVININTSDLISYHLSILNARGQLVHSESVRSGDAVQVGFLEEGFYFIQLSDGEKTISRQLIKR